MNDPLTSAAPTGSGRILAWLFAVLVAATWAIGLGLYGWSQHQDRTNAAATYEPVALDGPTPPAVRGQHLALMARPLIEHVVIEKHGRHFKHETNRLIPLAWPDWRPGQAVSFVAEVRSEADLVPRPRWQRRVPGAPAPAAAAAPMWLVHLEGSVPSGAASAFARGGVPVADGARVVRIVPSAGGRPAIPDASELEWRLATNACAGVTAFLLLTGVVVEFLRRRGSKRTGRKHVTPVGVWAAAVDCDRTGPSA